MSPTPLIALLGISLAIATLGIAGAGGGGPDATPAPGQPAPRALERIAAVVDRPSAGPRRLTLTIGRSHAGRPITATALRGLDPGAPVVLAIGCVHGDECAGIEAVERAVRGCPPPGGGLVLVPNLNPDGRAGGTRLNGRGVDLNRNFATGWRPIGAPGDPEHSGAAPFSEPEARLARRLIRALRPAATVWFHQQEERLVRAWGPSVPAARDYAGLANEPFVAMPWLDGTAPNWQNNRLPGTSSFVVELPTAGPAHAERHGWAIFHLGRLLADDEEPG